MPTGYTAAIEKGITFEQYLWSCARAFGALVTMRDDPADAPIPERLVTSDYHAKRIDESRAALVALHAMSPAECEAAAQAEYDEALAHHRERIIALGALRAKYVAMKAHAQSWNPPTAEHVELKKFMVEQIDRSVEVDCGTRYHDEALGELVRLSGQAWQEKRQKELVEAIGYHEKHHAEDEARTASRNQWIDALRRSLAPESVVA